MWFEVIDAYWFEEFGMHGSADDLISHYEKINVSAEFAMKIYRLRDVTGIKMFSGYINNEDYYQFTLVNPNELVLDIILPENNFRRFYTDNPYEFLFNLKMILGITINSHPKILELAAYINYDLYYFDKCINKP